MRKSALQATRSIIKRKRSGRSRSSSHHSRERAVRRTLSIFSDLYEVFDRHADKFAGSGDEEDGEESATEWSDSDDNDIEGSSEEETDQEEESGDESDDESEDESGDDDDEDDDESGGQKGEASVVTPLAA
jgi:hypothetical protein